MSENTRSGSASAPDAPAEAGARGESESPASGSSNLAGERGIASVNRASSLQSRLSNMLAVGLMVTLGFGLLTWYYARTFSRQSQVRQVSQGSTRAQAQTEMALPALGRVDLPGASAVEARSPVAEQLMGPPPALPDGQNPAFHSTNYGVSPAYLTSNPNSDPSGVPAAAQPTDRRLDGPVYTEATEVSRALPSAIAAANAAMGVPDGSGIGQGERAPGSDSDRFVGDLLRPSVTPAVQARILPTEQMLLPKGAFIDCTLETAIDSSLPGLTTCITATDTFGVDGRVVLLERGTKLVGETRGEVQQGAARIFVLWTEARTPTGVIVPLASPGTDELGRSGLPGTVNRHFLERFGAAILVSVIDGAVQGAVQSGSNGGAVIYNPGSSRDVLTEILKSTINIAPTIIKHNGDRIQILVARDLDFRSVYELHSVATRR